MRGLLCVVSVVLGMTAAAPAQAGDQPATAADFCGNAGWYSYAGN